MHVAVVFALLQQPAAPASFPVTKVEITPPAAEIEIGQTVRLAARALDARGQPVADAKIAWLSGGTEGDVDSTGLVKGGYHGYVRVTAVAYLPGQQGQVFGDALIHVLPEPAARIDVTPAPAKVVAGTRLTLAGVAFSKHGDRRADLVSFTSSNPRVASVTADGRLHALAPGRTTITAKAGGATVQLPVQAIANTITRLAVEPASSAVRTGDVVRFAVSAKEARGRAVPDVPVEWAVAATGGAGVAQIDPAGAFVAETPGIYTVTGSLGGRSADAVVRVEQRRVTRGIDVLAHLPIKYRAAEAWVHPSGKCLYMTTIADRVYAIDITDPPSPRIVDSMVTDARLVNDVMTTEDGKYGVFSREGASNRKNGIVVFDASDACHPKPVAEYTETVSGRPQRLCVSGTCVHHRRRDGLHAGDRLPRSDSPERGRSLGGAADRGGALSPRHHGGGRPRLPRLLERWAHHPRCRQWHEGRQSGEPAARFPAQVRPQRHLCAGRAALGDRVCARHAHGVACGPVCVRGR